LRVEFWGSPEYYPDMVRLIPYLASVKIWNRAHDYVTTAQDASYAGVLTPWLALKGYIEKLQYGNQHSTPKYLLDYQRKMRQDSASLSDPSRSHRARSASHLSSSQGFPEGLNQHL
jgi:hypothetical protein